MIKKITHSVIALASLFWMANANATFVFSDVSYTSNSVTFTIDGDMTGYAAPGDNIQFGLQYRGDIWAGPTTSTTYNANSWSASVFDNETINDNGNTGFWTGLDGSPYTWSWYDDTLANAVATDRTITLNFTQNWLDTSAANPLINFVWGWAGASNESITILARAIPTAEGEAPAPATLALLGLGLIGMGFSRKKKAA